MSRFAVPAMPPDRNRLPEPPHWPQVFQQLLDGEELKRDLISQIMGQVMTGQASEAQIGALLFGLRAKGETPGEIAAFVDELLVHSLSIQVPGLTLDTCGTGGDQAGTVNISTMAAVVIAAASYDTGVRVVKHGNRAASSKSGSADVLEELGVALEGPMAGLLRGIDEVGIGFCFAPRFHPAMRFVGQSRRDLGIQTLFNILGPLANPALPQAQVVGVADKRLAPVVAQAMALRGTYALVVRGDDGLDELTTTTTSTVWASNPQSQESMRFTLDPDVLNLPRRSLAQLRGGDAKYNANIARAVFNAERSPQLDPIRDAVLLNAAAGVVAADLAQAEKRIQDQSDLERRLGLAIEQVRQALDAGLAAHVLRQWQQLSQEQD